MVLSDEAARLRHALVDRLVAAGAVTDAAVERALRTVPRHALIDTLYLTVGETSPRPKARRLPQHEVTAHRLADEPDLVRLAYEDRALCVHMEDGEVLSTTSQPGLLAQMLELLDVRPGMAVPEVGTGIGYMAALLAELVGADGTVVTVDIDEHLTALARERLAATGYERVEVVAGDGAAGVTGRTFDRIVATVGCPDVPRAWREQLRDGGRIVVPIQHGGMAPIMVLTLEGDVLRGYASLGAGFIPLRGEMADHDWWVAPPAAPSRSLLPDAVALPAEVRTALAGSGAARGDLGFFLSLVERRATGQSTFTDGERRARVDLTTGTVHAGPGAGELAAAIVGHARRWLDLGRPAMRDLCSTFVLADAWDPADISADGTVLAVIDRPVHRQVVTVARGPTAAPSAAVP